MSNQALVAYATTEGQTAKVAARLGELLAGLGWQVTLHDCGRQGTPTELRRYDLLIFGGSVHMGTHQRSLRKAVLRGRASLNTAPSAFFSVSMAAAGNEAGRVEARAAADRFLDETGWSPGLRAELAGALLYRSYGPFTRWIMKRIAAKAGLATDTSVDHEYTDWDAVAAFARATSFMARSGRPGSRAA